MPTELIDAYLSAISAIVDAVAFISITQPHAPISEKENAAQRDELEVFQKASTHPCQAPHETLH